MPGEQPAYACLAGMGLTCVTTGGVPVLDRDAGTVVVVPIYLCRLPCDDAHGCSLGGDVCCRARTPDGAQTRACVPTDRCAEP
jgi:hypothetical protein